MSEPAWCFRASNNRCNRCLAETRRHLADRLDLSRGYSEAPAKPYSERMAVRASAHTLDICTACGRKTAAMFATAPPAENHSGSGRLTPNHSRRAPSNCGADTPQAAFAPGATTGRRSWSRSAFAAAARVYRGTAAHPARRTTGSWPDSKPRAGFPWMPSSNRGTPPDSSGRPEDRPPARRRQRSASRGPSLVRRRPRLRLQSRRRKRTRSRKRARQRPRLRLQSRRRKRTRSRKRARHRLPSSLTRRRARRRRAGDGYGGLA